MCACFNMVPEIPEDATMLKHAQTNQLLDLIFWFHSSCGTSACFKTRWIPEESATCRSQLRFKPFLSVQRWLFGGVLPVEAFDLELRIAMAAGALVLRKFLLRGDHPNDPGPGRNQAAPRSARLPSQPRHHQGSNQHQPTRFGWSVIRLEALPEEEKVEFSCTHSQRSAPLVVMKHGKTVIVTRGCFVN